MSSAQGHKTPLEGVALHAFDPNTSEFVELQVDSSGNLLTAGSGGLQNVVITDDAGNPVKLIDENLDIEPSFLSQLLGVGSLQFERFFNDDVLGVYANPVFHSYVSIMDFFGTGNSTDIDMSTTPMSKFSIQVFGSPFAVTSWTVKLQTVLQDPAGGDFYTDLITHATADGNKTIKSAVDAPALWMRAKVTALNLGGADHLRVIILASGR